MKIFRTLISVNIQYKNSNIFLPKESPDHSSRRKMIERHAGRQHDIASPDSITVHSSGPAAERFPHLLGRYDRVYCSDEGTPVYRRSAARVDRPENNTHFYYVYYSGMFLNIITILSLIHQNNLAPGWWVATLLELEAGSRVTHHSGVWLEVF